MSGYDELSCNALEQPFYHAISAAIRWCGLLAHEDAIMAAMRNSDVVPQIGQFPEWPCLRVNVLRLMDAMENGDLPFGRDGRPVEKGDHVNRARRTVRHVDLQRWMAERYPDQRPDFLFGPQPSVQRGGAGRWPWGDHETALLRNLEAAAKKFWVNYDPSDPTTAPTNEEVQGWLESQGVSKRVAEALAQILRADGLRPGPRPGNR